MKATFEQAFKNVDRSTGSGGSSDSNGSSSGGSGGAGAGAASARAQAPWALGYQMSERYSMLWNDELKARMLKVGLRWAGGSIGLLNTGQSTVPLFVTRPCLHGLPMAVCRVYCLQLLTFACLPHPPHARTCCSAAAGGG
jgi:hypothetical protein